VFALAPPPWLVRSARSAWHWQWRRLMEGLGPADASGHYRRPEAGFPALPPLPADAATAGSHVLIVGRSCPWAHRAWLVWSLRQLGGTIELVVVEPDPEAGRWCFATPFEGCSTLLDLYRRCGAAAGVRATVPLLYSCSRQQVLVGESARLIELLNQWPAPGGAPDLDPPAQRQATAQWRQRLQGAVNDGVYRCGFARNQAAYDEAETELFSTLAAAGNGPAAAPLAQRQHTQPGRRAAVPHPDPPGAGLRAPVWRQPPAPVATAQPVAMAQPPLRPARGGRQLRPRGLAPGLLRGPLPAAPLRHRSSRPQPGHTGGAMSRPRQRWIPSPLSSRPSQASAAQT
jgi:hypothetical protein